MKHLLPKPQRFYVNAIKHVIPKEATKAAHYKLIPMFAHLIFIGTIIGLISVSNSLLILLLGSIVSGISIGALFLYSHELSHGTIVKQKTTLYILENIFWALSGIPPTLWRRIHNMSHHHHINTYDDPDRKTFKSEAGAINKIYNLFIYPNKRLKFSLTVGFAMIFYSLKHIAAVFYSGELKPAIVTYKPSYSKRERRKIFAELLYILCFWLTIWMVLGWASGLVFSFISWISYSAMVMTFIVTQHLGDPVFKEIADPLLTSTSVKVPDWLDKIIDRHSYHVEHHVFPGINFDYYPKISQALQEKFPDRYSRTPLLQAIKTSYEQDVFLDDPLL